MLPAPDPVRLMLPSPAPAPARGGIPIVATLAPVAMSLAVWAFTRSVLSLLFAGLGPLVALAGLVDARLRRRRQRRAEDARLTAALARLREQVVAAHEAERARRATLCPPEGAGFARWAAASWMRPREAAAPLPVRVGRAAVASPVRLDGDDEPPAEASPAMRAAWEEVRSEARRIPDGAVLVDAADGIGIVGPLPLAAAVGRSVLLQLAATVPPDAGIAVPAGEEWATALPHPVDARTGDDGRCFVLRDGDRELRVAWARTEVALPPGCAAIVPVEPGARVPALGRAEARGRARALAEAAARHGLGSAAAPPEHVELSALLRESAIVPRPGSLVAPIGRGAGGPVLVDLVADGPHALVGGTTGSGKSELLVSWVLAIAHHRGPDEVTFLLVDFKGGAAFAPLAGMPHVVGILSDLDARLTRRAIESLRAELRRRERLLADAGARAIDELPGGMLPRLVVVVDEFAAVVAGQPELHEVFGDLAARGRSLGLHLILCTQRPAGVVRDGLLANVTLRIGLRMTDRGDSMALLGDDAAARLPAEPRGRAVLGGGESDGARAFQVALAGAVELDRARGARTGSGTGPGSSAGPGAVAHVPGAARPWLDPLPTLLPRSAIGAAEEDAVPFGLVDLPAEQRQPVAVHRPGPHGHLLVLGAAGTGRTTTLAVLAAAPGAVVLPPDPADAWQVLDGMIPAVPGPAPSGTHASGPAAAPGRRRLLLADDLDLLLARTPPEERHELVELLVRVLREGASRGIGVVGSAQRVAGALQPLAGLFGSRLVLRMPSREEHVLVGGSGADFDPALPPGAGRWRGAVVQVAWPGEDALPAPAIPEPVRVVPAPGRELAIIAAHPATLLPALHAAGLRVELLGTETEVPSGAGTAPGGETGASPRAEVLLGDPDAWQTAWALLARARRDLPMAVVGCSPAELRALTRPRDVIPPLGARPGECWLVEGGRVRRAQLGVPS